MYDTYTNTATIDLEYGCKALMSGHHLLIKSLENTQSIRCELLSALIHCNEVNNMQ